MALVTRETQLGIFTPHPSWRWGVHGTRSSRDLVVPEPLDWGAGAHLRGTHPQLALGTPSFLSLVRLSCRLCNKPKW